MEDCVAGYRNFFRSPNVEAWKDNIPKKIRKQAEQFSLDKIKNIISMVEPKLILTLGTPSFKKLCDHEDQSSTINRPWGSKTIDLIRRGSFDDIPVMGIPHLSGAQLENIHREEIKEVFRTNFQHD